MSIVINTDGGARGNPGPAAIGVVIRKGDETVATIGEYLGDSLTNNWAEYQALIRALEEALKLGFDGEAVEVRMDSELIVKQMKGEYKVKHPDLKPLHMRVRELIERFGDVTFVHVRREANKEADRLVNEALDAR